MKTAFISLGSVTYAIKARKLLMREGVASKLVKTDADKGIDGCVYGVEIKSSAIFAAADVLRRAGMSIKIYER